MTFATQIATLFVVLAVARTQAFEATTELEQMTTQVEGLHNSLVRKAAGFLAQRKDETWLEDKIEAEKRWALSRHLSFKETDADKDHLLKTGDELIAALMQHLANKESGNELFDAKTWLEPCKQQEACVAALFERVDTDRDGSVTETEYNDYLHDRAADEKLSAQNLAARKIMRSLKGADSDKDGVVSKEEFEKFFKEMDLPLEKAETQPTYAGFDEDHDGKVTTKEFKRQILKLVARKEPGEDKAKNELIEAGKEALNFAASFVEEGARARAGFWKAYNLKQGMALNAEKSGKVN